MHKQNKCPLPRSCLRREMPKIEIHASIMTQLNRCRGHSLFISVNNFSSSNLVYAVSCNSSYLSIHKMQPMFRSMT